MTSAPCAAASRTRSVASSTELTKSKWTTNPVKGAWVEGGSVVGEAIKGGAQKSQHTVAITSRRIGESSGRSGM